MALQMLTILLQFDTVLVRSSRSRAPRTTTIVYGLTLMVNGHDNDWGDGGGGGGGGGG